MEKIRNLNLLNRSEAHARHIEKLEKTLLFIFHFHFSTPRIIANLLGTTVSHARIFVENLEEKKLLRCLGGVDYTPYSLRGRVWMLSDKGVHLAEKALKSAPHYYPTSLDSARTSQLAHDLTAQFLTANWVCYGARILSTDIFERQKSRQTRLGKLHDAVVTYRNQKVAIEYERSTKSDVEMDQTILRTAENTDIDHCLWVIENASRVPVWLEAIASQQVDEWVRTQLNRWVKANTFSRQPNAGVAWIPLSARQKFHVLHIDEAVLLDAEQTLGLMRDSQKERLENLLTIWRKAWTWGIIDKSLQGIWYTPLRNEQHNFMICWQSSGWLLLNEDDQSRQVPLGFGRLSAVEGDELPLDVLDRAIHEARLWN